MFYSKNDFVKNSINVWKECLLEDFPVHHHDFSELVVVTGGKAVHIIDGIEYDIQAGDVYVIKGNTSHGFLGIKNLTLYNIAYTKDEPVLEYDHLRVMSGFQALFFVEPVYRKKMNFRHKLHLEHKDMAFAERFLEIMVAEDKSLPQYSRLLRIYFTGFIAFLSRCYEQQNEKSQINCIADTLAFIEENYAQPVTVDMLSEMAHLSSRQYARLFIQNYGITPKQYIMRLRIRYAARLLAQSAKKVSDIALECGFSDTNYFTSCFKQRTGKTPKEYRAAITKAGK